MCSSGSPQPVKAPPVQTVVAPQFRYNYEENLRNAQVKGMRQISGTRALQVPIGANTSNTSNTLSTPSLVSPKFNPYIISPSAYRIPK